MQQYMLSKRFLQDENVFCQKNYTYIYIHYKQVISLLNNADNLSLKYHQLNNLCTQNLNLNILVAIFPFVLNTPWSSNVVIITGSFIARFPIVNSSVDAAQYLLYTNLAILLCLLLHHFLRFAYLKRKKKSQ